MSLEACVYGGLVLDGIFVDQNSTSVWDGMGVMMRMLRTGASFSRIVEA